MSYYQLISLKLQLGIDPDTLLDHDTLLKMWKEDHQKPVAAQKTSAKGPSRAIGSATNVHYMRSA